MSCERCPHCAVLAPRPYAKHEPTTPRQREVLGAIQAFTAVKGYPPSFREMCTAFGIKSTNGINDHLRALERKGYITRDPLKSRAIRVVG